MSVSLTNTSAEPLLKTNSGFCSHCLLTLGSHPTKRAVDGEEYYFCCYGCCLAFQVKHGNREEPEAAWLLIRLGAGGFLAMNIMLFSLLLYSGTFDHADFELVPLVHWLLGIFATPVMLILGWPFFQETWEGILKGRLTSSTLITLGAGSAYAYSILMLFTGGSHIYFDTATMVLVLFTVGRYLEAAGRAKAVRNLAPLLEAEEQWAAVVENGQEKMLSVRQVKAGMIVRIRPGERIPVDGIVIEGSSSADETILTGESRPVRKKVDDLVLAGCINQEGSLLIKCNAAGSATRWGLLCKIVRDTLSQPNSTQRIVDNVASKFVPFVLLTTSLTVFYWQTEVEVNQALLHGLAVLVVACPCALGLAAPLATALGLGQYLQKGCLVRGAEVQEKLARIKGIAFDKTGTLTEGYTNLVHIECEDDYHEEVLRRSAALEQHSEHPLAHGIISEAKKRKIQLPDPQQVQAVAGSGILGYIEDNLIVAGRADWLRKLEYEISGSMSERLENFENSGHTAVCVGWDKKVKGILFLDDQLLSDVPTTVNELKYLGLRTLLLTGDLSSVGQRISEIAGIDEWEASLSPEDKSSILSKWGEKHGPAAMVGDGLNDGPVLASAGIGIAVGGATDLARETADMVLPEGGLKLLPWVIKLSRNVRKTIITNIMWAFGYNLAAIALAVSGFLQPILAALLMAGSSLLVVMNSLRLERFTDQTDNFMDKAEARSNLGNSSVIRKPK